MDLLGSLCGDFTLFQQQNAKAKPIRQQPQRRQPASTHLTRQPDPRSTGSTSTRTVRSSAADTTARSTSAPRVRGAQDTVGSHSATPFSHEVSQQWLPAFEHAESIFGDFQGVAPVIPKPSSQRGWKTVRVFVSSTFTDMHSERECLVKRVFPVLRKWCQSRRLHLVECDLRWGVPKDSTSGDTLRVCLGELDRCVSENVHPFFVGLLGDRCGWVPAHEEVPPALHAKYHWVDGFSVTGMEIMHGVYRTKSPNAVFLLRTSDSLAGLPAQFNPLFRDEGDALSFTRQLKRKVKFWFPSNCFEYTSQFSHVGADGKPVMTNLTAFESTVLNSLQSAIAAQYPDDIAPPDPVLLAKLPHLAQFENKTRLTVNLGECVTQIQDDMKNEHPISCKLEGPVGSGKSTLLAEVAKAFTKDPGWKVLIHFSGAGSGSDTSLSLLKRICMEWGSVKTSGQDEDSVHALALSVIRKLEKSPKKFLLCVDDLNSLKSAQHPVPDWWFQIWTNVSLLFTSTRVDFSLHKFSNGSFDVPQCKPETLINARLQEINKQLDPQQMALLCEKADASNPLYLELACEELRVFGIFEEVTNFIQHLEPTLQQLIHQIIGRIRNENGAETVNNFLSILAHCPTELYEPEMQLSLGASNSEFATIRQALAIFLAKTSEGSSLSFAHQTYASEIGQSLPPTSLGLVATLFDSDDVDPMRRAVVLPGVLQKMGETARLAKCLSRWEVFDYWYTEEGKYTLYNLWHSAGEAPMAALYQKTLDSMPPDIPQEEMAMRYFRVGELLFYVAQYDESKEFTTRSKALSANLHYGNTQAHAYAVNLLARLYERKGEIDLALQHYTAALQIRKKTKGCPELLIAFSLNNLAGFHLHHGKRYWDSLPLYQEALKIVKKLYGNQHVEVANLVLNIGQVYYAMGKLEEAEALYNESLELRVKLQGYLHEKTAIAYTNLADIHKKRLELAKAIDLYNQALDINTRVYGDQHPTVASDLVNLANCEVCADRSADDYYPRYQQALEIRTAVFGPDHALTKEVETLVVDHEAAWVDAQESGPSIVHRKCF
ncbi:telomerase protein component 1 [Pelomyxa schiedti]|nr:telomerase protein component 1 [Pelomyxa schiedti]